MLEEGQSKFWGSFVCGSFKIWPFLKGTNTQRSGYMGQFFSN